ncbi:WXG100 family type VII secretion target [Intestinimonas butyriciproducens]|nr:WXG100 family type VII secretion target [Intestinimonas butyriciproducens]
MLMFRSANEADLSFCTEELETAARNYSEIAEDLTAMKEELCRLLDALKDEGWTTNAGKAFADMVAVDWGETIDRYCDMLKTLSDILTKSAGQYEDLMESELSAIRVLS